MKYNFTSCFYLKSEKTNSKGQSPIYFRMTLNGQRIELATGKSIISDCWNKSLQRGRGMKEDIRVLNSYLDNVLGSQGFEAKMRTVFELRKDRDDPTLRHLCIVKGNYLPDEY